MLRRDWREETVDHERDDNIGTLQDGEHGNREITERPEREGGVETVERGREEGRTTGTEGGKRKRDLWGINETECLQ